MKDVKSLFEELYTEFVDDCNGYLIANCTMRGSHYDEWYKERMLQLCIEFHSRLSEVSVG